MFDWSHLFLILKWMVIALIPIGVILIRNAIIRHYEHEAFENCNKKDQCERDAADKAVHELKEVQKKTDWSWPEQRQLEKEILDADPKYQKLCKEHNTIGKILDILQDFFTLETLDFKSCWFGIPAWGSVIVGTAAAVILALILVVSIPCDIITYSNWEDTKAKYEAMEHPTFADCKQAEEENKSYKDLFFVTNEYKDKHELIDTESIWALFSDNVDFKRLHK